MASCHRTGAVIAQKPIYCSHQAKKQSLRLCYTNNKLEKPLMEGHRVHRKRWASIVTECCLLRGEQLSAYKANMSQQVSNTRQGHADGQAAGCTHLRAPAGLQLTARRTCSCIPSPSDHTHQQPKPRQQRAERGSSPHPPSLFSLVVSRVTQTGLMISQGARSGAVGRQPQVHLAWGDTVHEKKMRTPWAHRLLASAVQAVGTSGPGHVMVDKPLATAFSALSWQHAYIPLPMLRTSLGMERKRHSTAEQGPAHPRSGGGRGTEKKWQKWSCSLS